MTEMDSTLIPVIESTVGQATVQTVNAREIHAFLESKQQFSNWIQRQIETFGFTQDVDFSVINNFIIDETAFGGKRKTTEYHTTIDMAKELAMVERNAKGKEARQYFIAVERAYREQKSNDTRVAPAFDIPKTYADALQLAANQAKQLEVQSLIIEQQAPAVAFHKQVTENDGDLMRIEEACALLKRKTGQDFNQTTWLSFLRENGIAKLQNKYAGIGPKKFVPKAEYVPKWFVSSLSEHGVQMWLVRPVAVEQVFQMIERQRKSPDFLPILARRLLNHLTPSGSFLN